MIFVTGAEGGSKGCFWSEKMGLCMPLSRKSVACLSGDCAAVYTNSTGCPARCSNSSICQQCLENKECGWCAKPGIMGEGVCKAGGLEGKKCNDLTI